MLAEALKSHNQTGRLQAQRRTWGVIGRQRTESGNSDYYLSFLSGSTVERRGFSAQQAAEPQSLGVFSHNLPGVPAGEEVMLKQNIFSNLIVMWVVVPSLATFLCAGPAGAQKNSANYTFLVASGFLCDPGDSSTCPAAVKSANGDSYELSGAGTFDAQNKAVQAAGTYSHKTPNGHVLETGVWIATELVSFDWYGIAPGALRQKGLTHGPPPLGFNRLPMSSGPMPTGGLAVFRIRLLSLQGESKPAVLQANCALGDVPRERSVEGIRLTVESAGTEFFEETGGRVMFLAMRPEGNSPAKTPRQEPITSR